MMLQKIHCTTISILICKETILLLSMQQKKRAFENYINTSSNKLKASWNIVNQERNMVQSVSLPTLSATEFNEYFTNIANTLRESIPASNLSIERLFAREPSSSSFFIKPVSEDTVLQAVKSLKDSPCTDVFEMNSRILKETIELILPFLTSLINVCFNRGIFPQCFKLTKILPMFKQGDPNLTNNYRPISIIPIFGKVIEVIMKARLYTFLENNSVLCASQFGFRPNRSTTNAVQGVVKDVIRGLEKGEHTAIALCDLTKAFDCVPHELLLAKLEHYGVRGLPLVFFKSYLMDRSQCVTINNNVSEFKVNNHGVPQGSILGPILFLIFINDIHYSLLPNKCILFADDTTLLVSHRDCSQLNVLMNQLIERAEQWFSFNKLTVYIEKTQRLTISSNRANVKGDQVKLLGVVIDDGLNWAGHVGYLLKALPSTIFLLRQLKSVVRLETLISSYFAFFHSRLCYAVILWGNSSQSNKIFSLQKKAIRVLAGLSGREHCQPHFINFGILPLPCLYIYYTLTEIHKNINSFCLQSDIHIYNTRNSNAIRTDRFRLTRSQSNSLKVGLYNKLLLNR
uniref:Putative RNA-directed DNA polymerase from transposon BS n=1 Tax=Anoplophora glabripennis TaxID=217634 RepID=V5G2A3_ANOGL